MCRYQAFARKLTWYLIGVYIIKRFCPVQNEIEHIFSYLCIPLLRTTDVHTCCSCWTGSWWYCSWWPCACSRFRWLSGWCRRRGLSCRLRGRGCRTISWWSCKSNHTSFNYFDRLLFAIVHILRTFLTFSAIWSSPSIKSFKAPRHWVCMTSTMQ